MAIESIRFSAVGDITLGDHPLCIGFGAYSKFKQKPPDFPFEHVSAQLRQSDLTFGNLECVLSASGTFSDDYKSSQMRGLARQVDGMANSGFNIVNFANNHCMQHGKTPFLSTLKLLDQFGIRFCGVNLEDHRIGVPTLINANGVQVAFLGYSLRPRQYFSHNPFYSEGSPGSIAKDISRIKKKVDCVVVSLHWGDEFIEHPSPYEIRLGRDLIDAGADLIIGHHPHVLRGIENYKHGIIVYSLGNFVCDMIWDERLRESLIFSCTLTKSGIKDIELTPLQINADYQPTVLNPISADRLLSRLDNLSQSIRTNDLSEIDQKQQIYQRKADDAQQLYRNKGHRFFFQNILKYPPIIFLGHIKTFLNNRYAEIRNYRTCHKC